MVGEWREVSLEEVADEVTVGYVGPMASEYVSDGIPFLRSLNIERLRVNQNDLKFITPEFHQRIQKSKLQPGDVVIVRTGKPGTCSVVPDWLENANCSDLVIVRCGEQIDRHFLAYYMNSAAMGHVAAHLVGAVQQHFNVGSAKSLRLKLPPHHEQRAIAHILGTLDDKIELNRQRNQTLESMARALFKDWFVDFGPVRAKMEGRVPYLPPDLWKLFPDRLDNEGKPEGWRQSTIGNEVNVCGGATPSTKEASFWEAGQHHWATPKDLSSLESPVLLDTARRITDEGIAKISSGLLPRGTVLLSSRAPIGYLAIAEIPTAINQGFIAMRCDGVLSNTFVLFWCHENMEMIVGNANGSTFQEISKKNFKPIGVIVPPESILVVFQKHADQYYQQIVNSQRETLALAQLRDTLLPKLIAGEIRIHEAEKLGETVA